MFERRALYPDLLQRNDDPRRMEAREGRNGAQGAVSDLLFDKALRRVEGSGYHGPPSDEAGYDGTNDLLGSDIIRGNEKPVWFLSQHLVDVPLVKAD